MNMSKREQEKAIDATKQELLEDMRDCDLQNNFKNL